MKKLDLETLVNMVDDMPILPGRVNKIISLTENTDSSVKDIEKEILKDQSLTSKVLKLANSTYYGYARKISTISEATVLLGFQVLKSIALASTLSKFLINELPGGYKLKKYDLWNQSQSCAIIARYIAKKINFPKPEEAYTAGLLRDIGKIILNQYVALEFENILNKVENEGKSFLDAELEVLGFHHGHIGAKVAEKWNFPNNLVEAILYHHSPDNSKIAPKLVSIIHIADAITMMIGVGLGSDGLAYNFSSFALETLDITELDVQEIIAESTDFLQDSKNFCLD